MKILRINNLAGPNLWAHRPVLEVWLDIERFEELPSHRIPGFPERLQAAMPSLWSHRCSEGHPGGFFERLRTGTYMGHILEHVVLELQTLAGMDVGFGKTRGVGRPGVYRVVISYLDEAAARLALDAGMRLLEGLAGDPPSTLDLAPEIEEIREVGQRNSLGPSTRAIVEAARRRGIPVVRVAEDRSLVQLGYGRWARWIQASETSSTANVAVEIAQDKELTKTILGRLGVPVPDGGCARSPEAAWELAQEIGTPVAVKPVGGNQGKGVGVDLRTREEVEAAAVAALRHDSEVIVERSISGEDHRLLVVNGRLVAAARRRVPVVTGDGVRCVRELVAEANADPRRGSGHGAVLTRIPTDALCELALQRQGLDLDAVPEAGRTVRLRENCNLSTGGTAQDVTDRVHPANARLATLAARAVGLDVAGIDVVCRDIAVPLGEQGGAVIEVNAAPGLRMHIAPSEGEPRPVGEAIVDGLFPEDRPERLPIIAVTGTNGKTTVTRMIAHVFQLMGRYVGMTSTDGVYFDGERAWKGDCSGPRSAQSVLQHPDVEVAVLETARGGILRSGLGWEHCQVAVVTNVGADHLGLDGIDTVEDLSRVKRVPVESVRRDGFAVLNADDPLVAAMAEHCKGRTIYFATNAQSGVVLRHTANRGRAVVLRGGAIVLAEGCRETHLLRVDEVPATMAGAVGFQVANTLAAAAAAWAAGAPLDAIRVGLRTFQADAANAPGRFNLFEMGGARVIVDYGHNPHALRALGQAVKALGPRRIVGVVGAPGDRRDEDVRELATIAADLVDVAIVREDDDLRGRRPGEVAGMIAAAIAESAPAVPVRVVRDARAAVEEALAQAEPGDAVVLLVDRVDEALEQVRATIAAHAAAGAAAGARDALLRPTAPGYVEPAAVPGVAPPLDDGRPRPATPRAGR